MPLFPHDCTNCRYLGTVMEYDMYVCERSSHTNTITSTLARYGPEGKEYVSNAFIEDEIKAVHRHCSGIDNDRARILALFRACPSLILNKLKRP
jgi:hypothetical protein